MIQNLKSRAVHYAAPYIIPYAMPIAKWWYGSATPGCGRKWTLTKVLIISPGEHAIEIEDFPISVDSSLKDVYAQMRVNVPQDWENPRVELRFVKGAKKQTKKRIVVREEHVTDSRSIRDMLTQREHVKFTAAVLDLGDHMQKFNILRRVRKYVVSDTFRAMDFFPTDDPESLQDGRCCRLQFLGATGTINNRKFAMTDTLSKIFRNDPKNDPTRKTI